MSVKGIDTHCRDCGIECLPDTPPGFEDWHQYMVHNDVWAAASMPRVAGGWLCVSCLQQRLGRPLTSDDLTDAMINDPGRYDDTPVLHALKVAAEVARFRRAERRVW